LLSVPLVLLSLLLNSSFKNRSLSFFSFIYWLFWWLKSQKWLILFFNLKCSTLPYATACCCSTDETKGAFIVTRSLAVETAQKLCDDRRQYLNHACGF
jgi:hypothetical protein